MTRRTHRPARMLVAIVTTAIAAGAIGGCGGDKSTKSSEPASSSTPTPTSTADDIQAKIVADAPPTNLTWLVPTPPKTWKKQDTEPGVLQWQVGNHPCIVTISQPRGVGTAKEPTSAQVVMHEVQKISRGVGMAGATAQPKITASEAIMVKTQVVGLDAAVESKFITGDAEFGNGAQARIRARRSGDFALIASAVCGKGAMPQLYDQQIGPFFDALVARTTY